jgi:hypothetical protein
MLTRFIQTFAVRCSLGAALALTLTGAPVLCAQEAPAPGAPAAPAADTRQADAPPQPTQLELAQAQLAQAQAQLAQAQAQLARALALAQLAQDAAPQPGAPQAAAPQPGAPQAQQAQAAAPQPGAPLTRLAQALFRKQPEPQSPPAVPGPAVKQPDAPSPPKASEPFAFGDFTWLTGNSREKQVPLDTPLFTPEFRLDANYIYSFNHPKDHTLDGSAESGRTNELQVQQLGIGGDFHWNNVRGRLMTQFGMYSQLTPRNDASPSRGQWNLADAYRYISEAYGGYHWDVMHGVNLDAGIFLSYIGLFGYYNYDNWAYQPSYVSANTPWFFNGFRLQTFPTDKLKVELWLIDGWQSYGMFNGSPGYGTQILWRPNDSVELLTNDYWGRDTLGISARERWHSDSSFLLKYYDRPGRLLDKAAFSLTFDIGCENGGGVSCAGGTPAHPSQYFVGFMFYNRFWFHNDHFGLTLGGGEITNPGRYLVLLPPINGATAASGTQYFTTNPGDPFRAWDASVTFDWLPVDYITFRWELNRRVANVPYFVGPGGITPDSGNSGPAGSLVPNFNPDLRKAETRLNFGLLVKF